MKFLLWKPGMDEGTLNDLPHTGLGILARELKEYGAQIVFIDNHFAPVSDEYISDYISTFRPDTICLSLVSSEWLLDRTQNLINEAYSKGIEVWVGGPHAYGYGDLLAKDERLNKIVIGEIDGQIDRVLSSQEKLIHLEKPAIFKSPDFTEMYHAEKIKNYPVFVSRGCNYNCSFCFSTKTHGNRWRKRPVDDAFWHEMSQIKKLFPNVHTISIIDDAFTTNLRHVQ